MSGCGGENKRENKKENKRNLRKKPGDVEYSFLLG